MSQPPAATSFGGAPRGPPRHTVLPPPPSSPTAPEQTVAVAESTLVDVMLLDHRHTLLLFNKLLLLRGNSHATELLAGAIAVDIRLHIQACLDVLIPLLERRYGSQGVQLAAQVQQQLQVVERDVLEMLTFRRERDWQALAERANLAHKDYAALVHNAEVGILPRLAADMKQEELVSSGLLFQRAKQTASLVPHTGVTAFEAAGAAGPQVASVLGGPLVAGQYQHHSAHHRLDVAAPATAGEMISVPPQQYQQQQGSIAGAVKGADQGLAGMEP